MKHTTSRMLFSYWDGLRGERAAPDRADIRPGDIRHVLADAFILAQEDDLGPVFRLAGTRVEALFGRDLRDKGFRALWPAGDQTEADHLVGLVSGDAVGLVIGLLGRNENGSEIPLEMLLLPLRHRGRTDRRMLGSLSPASIPSWAGLVPLRSVTTRSLRIVQPNRNLDRASDAPPVRPGRRSTMFVVHEGGRL